jgi:hypothetical protein
MDLSFLNMESENGDRPARLFVWKAHDTVLLFGCDVFQWTGYAFSSCGPSSGCESEDSEGETQSEHEEEDEDEDEDEDGEEVMPNEDIFASGGSDHVIDENHPIWDPRTYFLRTAAIRANVVYDQYTYLIQTLDAGITEWVRCTQYPRTHDYSFC